MKQIYNLILLLLLVLGSCSNQRYGTVLSDIDSISNDNPKLALEKLDSLYAVMDTTNVSDLMYYKLVKLKAQDKSYIPHPSIDNLNVLIKYYEGDGDKHLLPQVYYLAGTTYDELHDSPAALRYYNKALDAMNEYDNLRLRGLTYARIGYVLRFQDNYKDANASFAKSLKIDELRKDTIGVIFDLCDMGEMYLAQNKEMTAMAMYKKALGLAENAKNSAMIKHAKSKIASLCLGQENPNVHVIASYLLPILKNVEPSDQSGYYTMAFKYYSLLGIKDSSDFYGKKVLKVGNIYSKKYVCQKLLEREMCKADARLNNMYRQYKLYVDSVDFITNADAINKAHALYNYSLQEKLSMELAQEKTMRKYWLLFCIVLLGAASIVCYLYSLKVKHEKKEKDRQLKELNYMLKEARLMHENRKNAWLEMRKTHIFRMFLEKARSKVNVTVEEWNTMEKLVDENDEQFKIHLYRLYSFKPIDYQMCILIKLGFSLSDIAEIQHRSSSALTMARKRLFKKVFNKDGKAEDFDKFIVKL